MAPPLRRYRPVPPRRYRAPVPARPRGSSPGCRCERAPVPPAPVGARRFPPPRRWSPSTRRWPRAPPSASVRVQVRVRLRVPVRVDRLSCAEVTALITSSAADRGALLLHRLAELHARIPQRQFPIGADVADRIHYGSTYWTSGFWPGALWQAAKLAPANELFVRWALTATLDHFGQEHSGTHDVGFEYGESSLAAWRAL